MSGPHTSAEKNLKETPKSVSSARKIDRNGIKIRKNCGGRISNLEHFSLLRLLPILHGF
jgi:hypothetical protein